MIPSALFLSLVRDRRLWIPCALFLGALAVRLAYLLESRGNPFFDAPVVDARTYLEQARLIAAGDLLGGDRAFYQPPAFPCFLAAFLRVFGDGVFAAVRVAHALIGACSCLLLYRLALRALPSAWAAAAAAAALALWGPLVYFEGELLSVALEVFLYLFLLLLLARARERTGLARWGAAGLVGGLAAVTRPNIMLFLLLAACALPRLRPRPAAGRYLRQLLAALVGFACVVGPVTWRNAAVGGEFVLVSANGGVNFYIGNNVAADSTVAIHPGMHWERLMAEPVEAGYELPGERSAYFTRRAFRRHRLRPPGLGGADGKEGLAAPLRTGGQAQPGPLLRNRALAPVVAAAVGRGDLLPTRRRPALRPARTGGYLAGSGTPPSTCCACFSPATVCRSSSSS